MKKRFTLLLYGIGVPVIAITYGIICIEIIGGAWMRKEGDLPPISPWLEELGWVTLGFPFGYLGVDSILILPVVNGAFWGITLVTCGYLIRKYLTKRPRDLSGAGARDNGSS